MTKLRERMLQDMQLRRFSERTRECYVRSVRQLVERFNNKPPGQITEQELRNYFYGLLLRTTAKAIQKLARDPEWVGGEIGLLGVSQTPAFAGAGSGNAIWVTTCTPTSSFRLVASPQPVLSEVEGMANAGCQPSATT